VPTPTGPTPILPFVDGAAVAIVLIDEIGIERGSVLPTVVAAVKLVVLLLVTVGVGVGVGAVRDE
jgi:hypothetical protein